MILELQRTDGVADPLDRILDGMRKIIHGVDAPLIACIVVSHMRHSIDYRISHIDIRGSHIDAGTQYLLAVRKFSLFHLFEQLEVLLHAAVAGRIILAGLFKGSAVLFDLLCRQIGHISFALLDQLHGSLIHLPEIVGGKEKPVLPVCTEPCHVFLDGLYKLFILFGRICVIETQIKLSVIFLRQSAV